MFKHSSPIGHHMCKIIPSYNNYFISFSPAMKIVLAQDGCLPYGTLIISYLRCCSAAFILIISPEPKRHSVIENRLRLLQVWRLQYRALIISYLYCCGTAIFIISPEPEPTLCSSIVSPVLSLRMDLSLMEH